VAVRMPAHPVARALLQAAGVPIGAPSANSFTRPSATTAAHVLEDLDGRIDIVLDGGPTAIGLESTVLDLSRDRPLVLRPGGVDLEDLRPFLPDVELSPAFLDRETASRAPGQMLKHYSPRARLLLFTGNDGAAVQREMQLHAARLVAQGQRPGLLLSMEEAAVYTGEAACQRLGPKSDLHAMGQQLFAAIRALDAKTVDTILVRDYGRSGIGAALWDRLLRAAEGKVIEVPAGDSHTDQQHEEKPNEL
jgi:L-threonylcarbamoyladenylate synthase